MALIGYIRKHMEIEPGDADLGDAEGAGDEPEDRRAQRFAPAPLDIVGAGALGVAGFFFGFAFFFLVPPATLPERNPFFSGTAPIKEHRRRHQQTTRNTQ